MFLVCAMTQWKNRDTAQIAQPYSIPNSLVGLLDADCSRVKFLPFTPFRLKKSLRAPSVKRCPFESITSIGAKPIEISSLAYDAPRTSIGSANCEGEISIMSDAHRIYLSDTSDEAVLWLPK